MMRSDVSVRVLGGVVSAHDIQCSVHPPNRFIRTHIRQLLPDWVEPVASVLVVLQRSPILLINHTLEAEASKDQLRERFLVLGHQIAHELAAQGYAAEVFDPRTGMPTRSHPGPTCLDDVAVSQSLLGYCTTSIGRCVSLIHPHWGQAVYPSTLVSAASPAVLQQAVNQVLRDD